MLYRLAAFLALSLPAFPAFAFEIDTPPDGREGTVANLGTIVLDEILPELQGIFAGVLILFIFLYGLNMIMYSSEDSEKNESKTAFVYAIFGMIVVSITGAIVRAVAPGQGFIADTSAISEPLLNIVAYCEGAVYIALLVNIAVQGFRIVSSQGEQEYIDRSKKRLITGFIGVVIVLLARLIVEAAWDREINRLGSEVAGIANFFITMIGFAAVTAIAIAGFMLVLSVSESWKDKAKTIIKTSVVALIVTLLAYVIVYAVIDFA